LDDHRQRAAAAARGDLGQERTQVGLAAKRPVGADADPLDGADLCEEVGGDGFVVLPTNRLGNCHALVDESLALGLAPARDVARLDRVDRCVAVGIELVHEARRRGERSAVVVTNAHARAPSSWLAAAGRYTSVSARCSRSLFPSMMPLWPATPSSRLCAIRPAASMKCSAAAGGQ